MRSHHCFSESIAGHHLTFHVTIFPEVLHLVAWKTERWKKQKNEVIRPQSLNSFLQKMLTSRLAFLHGQNLFICRLNLADQTERKPKVCSVDFNNNKNEIAHIKVATSIGPK